MRRSGSALVAVAVAVLMAAPLLFWRLGRPPFDDPGEGMHAEIARELSVSDDPFALTLDGVHYVDKPPLLYVLMAGVFRLTGPTEGAARLVSALAALAAVGATAWLGARLLGAGGGVLSGLALLSCVGFFAYGRYVRPETLFLAALAAGFALVLAGLIDGRRRTVVAGFVAFGLAGLAKDPLGVIGPPVVIGLALTLGGRARPLGRWLPPAGVALALVFGFAWWGLVELRTPGFTWYTVVDNHLLNVAHERHFPDEDVPLTLLQFLLVSVAGALPWVIPAGAEVARLARPARWREPGETPWVVLALWAVAVVGLTALSRFRLPHYGLPAYPALALLAARGWQRPGGRVLCAVHAGLFALIAVACGLAGHTDGTAFIGQVMGATDVATRKAAVFGQASALPPWEAIRPLLRSTAGVFGAGALAAAVVAVAPLLPRIRRALGSLAVVATMLAAMPAVGQGLALVATSRAVRDLAREVGRRAAPGDVVAVEGPIENAGAFEWYSGRRAVIVDGRLSVLGFGATRPEAADVFWDATRLDHEWGAGRTIWLLTAREPGRTVVSRLPGARLVAASGGRWLWINR